MIEAKAFRTFIDRWTGAVPNVHTDERKQRDGQTGLSCIITYIRCVSFADNRYFHHRVYLLELLDVLDGLSNYLSNMKNLS
jgi:hypothetical protein